MEADGPFSVDNKGEIKVVKELDYEKQTAYQLVVWATDGLTVMNHTKNRSRRKFSDNA